ncbi:MAG: diacylglycerol kinase family protein [Candidatus Aminicenantes bacterium]|jgi:diacylglycerol kinase family enzyme
MSKVNKNTFSPEEAICIVNPTAARNKWKRRKRLRENIKNKLQCKIIDIYLEKENIIETARKQSLERKIIVAAGGDGTIAHIIQGIIDSGRADEIRLGIITFGSGNAFRKSLGIPKNPKKAMKVLFKGEARKIDLIDIEGKMAGFASVGATAEVSQKKLQHKIPGLLGHLLASRIMVNLPKNEYEIELFDGVTDNGEHFEKKSLNVRLFECVIGKTRYFGYSWKAAPQARIDDGYLDITLFETGWLKYLIIFPLNYLGLFQKTQKHFKAKKLVIRGEDLPVQYNGEFLDHKDEITFKVRQQVLKVIS